MAKDKNKKKKNKKKDKPEAAKAKPKSTASRLKALSENPLVADVVTAALVATAAALKDPKKARQLAAQTGDELSSLAKEGAERGTALWQLAMDVGRRSLDAIIAESPAKGTAKPSPSKKPGKPAPAKKTASAKTAGTRKKAGAAKKPEA